MSSNPSNLPIAKAVNNTGQLSPASQQPPQSLGGEGSGQRRSGGSGNLGAASFTKGTPSPRNNQTSRKQHKSSKRFRLTDDDAIAESAVMHSTSSRKGQTSITHLMNFSLPPRPQNYRPNNRFGGNNRYPRRNATWGLGSGYHAMDKARYVHANYRFIVDPRGYYHVQSVDADVHLDWNNVLQILASAQSQSASCPICLGEPVAPRMAKCGHIFCLACLIRFMHSEDESKPVPEKKARWKKCPICYDTIYISETRPVRWYYGQEGESPREGGDVVLRLILRPASSTLALPRDGADALNKEEDIPWYMAAEVMDYARIMKGSEDYMTEQYDEYIKDMERQEKEDELMFGEDNAEWTRKAVRSLQEAKEKIVGIGNPPSLPPKPTENKPKKPPIVFNENTEDIPDMYTINNAMKSGQSLPDSIATSRTDTPSVETPSTSAASGDSRPRDAKPRQNSTSNPAAVANALKGSISQFRQRMQHHDTHQPSEYHFYQALLHYYLSPLDIRILKAAFGNYSSFPSTILPRVERVSNGHVVDDDLRKRVKYLAHLPYGCEVNFLECDWTDTVPEEILERFKPEIERRRKRNHDKEAREEKARIRAEREEDEKYAAARRKRPGIAQDRFSADDFTPLVAPSSDLAQPGTSVDTDQASSSPPWNPRRGQSFAPLASPSTSPSAPRTVWGTAAIRSSSPIRQAPQDHDVPDDGWLQGWEKDLLQEEDMVAQVQAMSIGESSKAGAASGGKKKKAKKITLMSTNARRGA